MFGIFKRKPQEGDKFNVSEGNQSITFKISKKLSNGNYKGETIEYQDGFGQATIREKNLSGKDLKRYRKI